MKRLHAILKMPVLKSRANMKMLKRISTKLLPIKPDKSLKSMN